MSLESKRIHIKINDPRKHILDNVLYKEVSVKKVKELFREAEGRGINFAVTLLNNTLYGRKIHRL